MSWPYTYRWEKRSKDFLRRNPLCVMCAREGRIRQAQVVDHIVPHGGGKDQVAFWDEANNWQGLCKAHHDGRKKSIEVRGYDKEVDLVTGLPPDPNHPFNRNR